MGFLDSIEKLINEHVSATVLRERIALLNEQHAALENQVVALKQEVAILHRKKTLNCKQAKTRDQVQDDLIHATFLCLKHNGGTTPFQQIFDAISTAAHRKSIIKWVETFAPVMMRDLKFVLNKSAYTSLNRDFILSNFDTYIEETGMANTKWYLIAKKTSQQKPWVSIVSGGGGPGTGKRR